MARTWSPQQEAVFEWFRNPERKRAVVRARAGTGKCLGLGTPVLRYDGAVVPVETVKSGDLLMGPDSTPRRVLSISRGTGPLFRIVPVKGDSWVCNDVHVMTLAGTNRSAGQTIDVPLAKHLADCATRGEQQDRNWKLWRTGVEFTPQAPLPVDPYLFGVWIGDGTTGAPEITNREPEISEHCAAVAGTYGAELVVREDVRNNTRNLRFRVGVRGVAGRNTPSTLRRFFSVCSITGEKSIPQEYLTASRAERLALLAGLVDTDGFLTCGGYEIAVKSRDLAAQVLFLARSLGLAAYASVKTVAFKSGGVGEYQRIFISGDLTVVPCKVPRRMAPVRKQKRRVTVTGWRAEPIGDGDFYGFTLDGDGRFLLGDFTVTHNTTTILEGLKYAPEKRVLFCAFNKRIERELSGKIASPNAEAMTLHSLGYSFIRRNWENVYPDGSRGKQLAVEAAGGSSAPDAMIALVAKLSSLGKEMVPYAQRGADLLDVAYSMDCTPDEDWEDDGWTAERVAECAFRAMMMALEKSRAVDFSDMLFLPLRHRWVRGKWDLVVVDEAQDMNAAQIELATRAVTKDGRILVVGDDRQAIYGFRGADSGSLDRLKRTMSAEELPLTVTYRCPQAVVAEAQRLVPDYQAAATAPVGKVETLPIGKLAEAVSPGDFVLSRKNAPLTRICLAILRRGVKAKVEGKDIGKGLVALVKKLKPKSIPHFLERLEAWEAREKARAAKLKKETADRKCAEVEDQAECLRSLSEGMTSVAEMERRIGDLFEDDAASTPQVVCSSVHRAKGLESPRVFVLRSTLIEGKDGKSAPPEEANIAYVAITRAADTLVWVEGEL